MPVDALDGWDKEIATVGALISRSLELYAVRTSPAASSALIERVQAGRAKFLFEAVVGATDTRISLLCFDGAPVGPLELVTVTVPHPKPEPSHV